jgi:hypothetical protein
MAVAYREDFGTYLSENGLMGNGIEIGVSEGNYSVILIEKSKLSKIYLLDTWKHFNESEYNDKTNGNQSVQDARYAKVVERMRIYGDRVEIIRGDARLEFNRFTDAFFDFVYIDANHKYDAVKIDIANWYPKVRGGGVLAGHDYMDGIKRTGEYGVKSAVDEFCRNIGITPLVTGGRRRCPPSWYFKKEG